MERRLTLDDLSQRIREPVQNLRRWHSLGLIGGLGHEEFLPRDTERARLIQFLLRRGVDLAAIVKAEREREFSAIKST